MANKMKPALLASLFWIGCSLGMEVCAEKEHPDPWLPEPGMVGDWDTVSERFKKWEIADFEDKGIILDGGSHGFAFKATDGSEFQILVASPAWWTQEDWNKKQQPIFLQFEGKSYRVTKGSEYEKALLLKLRQAATDLKGVGRRRPIYIGRLHDLVESRELRDNFWPLGDLELDGKSGSWNKRVLTLQDDNLPFDRLDLEGATGDWDKIRESFHKWEIAKFNEWDTLGDSSTIFRFTTSDGTEIGILVPTISPWHPPRADDGDLFAHTEPVVFPQVIFLHYRKRLYRIDKGGESEAKLLAMLDRAAKELNDEGLLHPNYIKYLRGIVNTRTIVPYGSWPLGDYDLSEQQDAGGNGD